jgi:predicted ester cyclase
MNMSPGNTPRSGIPVMPRWPGRRWRRILSIKRPGRRRQGPEGAILASRAFRQAVPDLRCDVEQMIVAGDRVVSHLHFHGHFTGTFGTRQGKGQNIDFIATDIYQIRGGKITANWHIEDNLTLMKQLGAQ